jgi:hypothetical protein
VIVVYSSVCAVEEGDIGAGKEWDSWVDEVVLNRAAFLRSAEDIIRKKGKE